MISRSTSSANTRVIHTKIKLSKEYAKAHLYVNRREFACEPSPPGDNILYCRYQSRHSNNTKYFLCVRFDENDDGDPIKDRYCQCKSGTRMVGCCGHIAAVLWYLGYVRHFGWILLTGNRSISKKKSQNVDKYSPAIRYPLSSLSIQ